MSSVAYLVLFPDLPPELLLEVLAEVGGDVRNEWVEGGHEPGVEREEVLAVAVDREQGPGSKES